MIIADLHIHSRYSRATARSLDPEHLWLFAQRKGVDLVGSGDFTHPAWLDELAQKLEETGDGAYRLKPEHAAGLVEELPPACAREVRFLLSGEISSIYKRGGRTRKVHSLILVPDLDSARCINRRLDLIGNITSDGRPILGLDAHDLLELCLEECPEVIFIPAHIWTPWFSLFGSKSGFEAIEECFDDLTPHIHALETGLSSDPPMNWRLSALDRFNLVSNSDAHSPGKLAREANLFNCAPTFEAISRALADKAGDGLYGTLEFFPDEGKYHLDGHRKCGVCLPPRETRRYGGICPECGKPMTVGVLNRVEELADRPLDYRPPKAKPFESLVPLDEVTAEVLGRGPNTKGVRQAVNQMLYELGPELTILREAPLDQIARIGGPLMSEAVKRMRAGQVSLQGGYDGEFGVVRVFEPAERDKLLGQSGFWAFEQKLKPRSKKAKVASAPKPRPRPEPLLTMLDPASEGLDPEQAKAAAYRGGHLIVRAGPGSGKTRLLVQRAVGLLDDGVEPERILPITFTNKAAGELSSRLAACKSKAGAVKARTFHALGRMILLHALGAEPELISPEEREGIIKDLAAQRELKSGDLDLLITRLKQKLEEPAEAGEAALLAMYQAELKQRNRLDLDDLVREAALALWNDPAVSGAWQGRYAHILVDEYQDVNQAQVELLKGLCGPDTKVTAIGDPDQAIYGFRGAEASFFTRFGEDFPGAASMGLIKNYRTCGLVLQSAAALISHAPEPHRTEPHAMRPGGHKPVALEFGSPQAEAAWLAAEVVRLLGGLDSRQVERGLDCDLEAFAASDIAVLYRLHAMAGPLQKALLEAGVPVQVAAKQPLAETDPLDFKAQRVSLLSMHAAKGLEWPVVFVAGLEEGVVPYTPPDGQPSDPDEERRLLYVAMTRAERRLYMTRCQKRMIFGRSLEAGASRYWAEIPSDGLAWTELKKAPRRARQLDLF